MPYFTPETVLGRGTFGTVYGAVARDGTPVAVKFQSVLPCDVVALADELKCHKLVAAEPHPNVLRVSTWFVDQGLGKVALLMDAGALTLHGLLKSQSWRVDPPLVAHLAWQLAAGVRHMHKLEIIHRDLKPANCILFCRMAGLELQISDFGASRVVSCREQTTMDVTTGPYRAPEMFRLVECCLGNEKASSSSPGSQSSRPVPSPLGFPMDIWAAGCIFGELSLGKVLFQIGDSDLTVLGCMVARLGGPPDGMSVPGWNADKLRGLVPEHCRRLKDIAPLWGCEQVAKVVLQCCQWEPGARPTAAVVAEELLQQEAQLELVPPVRAADALSRDARDEGSADVVRAQAAEPLRPTQHGDGEQSAAAKPLQATVGGEACADSTTRLCECPGRNCGGGVHGLQPCRVALDPDAERYCRHCRCTAVSCQSRRLRAPWCYRHALLACGRELELTSLLAKAGALPYMVPADISALFRAEPQVSHDLLLEVVVSFLKEPAAMALFLETSLPKKYTGREFGRSLLSVCWA